MKKSFICFAITLIAALYSGCGDEITNVNGPVDWQGPTVEWTSPMDAEVRGTVGLDVSVVDSSNISRVKMYVDGREDQTLSAAPYRFAVVTDSLPDGVHLCEARAWDQYENLGISPVLRVNVANSVAQGPRVLWVPDSLATIQAAINAAQDFDTIRVRDGTYYETLNTFGKGIWIESEQGPMRCTLSAGGLTNVFFVPPSQLPATIHGFTLTAAFNVIFIDDGAQLDVFNNMFISNSTGDSSYTMLFSGFGCAHIINNLFSGSRVTVQMAAPLGNFENNIIQHASEYAMWNRALSGNPVFHGYNLFWQNGHDYAGFTQGPGEFNADPLIDLANGRLLPGSPCIDAGDPSFLDLDSSRSDIGPFGGPLGYR